nr:ST.9 [Starmerella bombicola]
MKFSSTLQFNAVPEWRDHYVDYDRLKKLIFRLERANVLTSQEDYESLIGQDPTAVFAAALDEEVLKIDTFYQELERKLKDELLTLEQKMQAYFGSTQYRDLPGSPNSGSPHSGHTNRTAVATSPETAVSEHRDDASDSSEDEAPPQRRRSNVHDELVQKRSVPFENVSLRREITRLYVLSNEILSFSDLNREGIRKALKKFDKVHGTVLLPHQMGVYRDTRVFSDAASHDVGAKIDRLVAGFAILVDEPEAKASETLSSLLREHIVYERNTVWRELIGIERQAQGVQPGNAPQQSRHSAKKLHAQALKLCLITAVFLVLLMSRPLSSHVQSRCLAVVVLASLLWATEALPLFVTSLLIPLLVVVLRIPVGSDGEPMPAKEASSFVFSKMWSPVIPVLLGGFTLAAALSKYNMAKALAQIILAKSGTDSPRKVVLVLMLVASFLCMWISNVAAPVLMFSVAQPLLRIVPAGDPFNQALVLGIALASNVGGMASPIASPQNILALQNMTPVPSWIEWFCVAIPVAIFSIFCIWLWLCMSFPVTEDALTAMQHLRSANSGHALDFGKTHAYIFAVTVVTIALWCLSHQIEHIVGDMGVLALLPIVLLFGPGILNAADFNNFLWTIVALAMGGIVLGQSVESCGLLEVVAVAIKEKVAHLPLFVICLALGFMVLVVASFISHTVAALIILPLVKSVGEQLDDPHPRAIVMISALLCSAAMALPTSGFPNVTAVCMVDELGQNYLTVKDFITHGIPSSILVYLVVVTLGYFLCILIGF